MISFYKKQIIQMEFSTIRNNSKLLLILNKR